MLLLLSIAGQNYKQDFAGTFSDIFSFLFFSAYFCSSISRSLALSLSLSLPLWLSLALSFNNCWLGVCFFVYSWEGSGSVGRDLVFELRSTFIGSHFQRELIFLPTLFYLGISPVPLPGHPGRKGDFKKCSSLQEKVPGSHSLVSFYSRSLLFEFTFTHLKVCTYLLMIFKL